MPNFVEEVREMNERVIELSRSHAILWVFWAPKNYKRYSKVIVDHRDFFDAIVSSLFQGFCVITYQLFDTRGDVKSLPALINYLASLNPVVEQRLKTKVDTKKPLLDKYSSFRHKIYAHRDKLKAPWEIFGRQSKTRLKAEMEAIVRLTQEIIGALTEAAGVRKSKEVVKSIRKRQNYAAWDAREILEALGKQR